jgi:FKBP-type peptidyl-prolyl cis-trans isomerase (trigger factor)
MRELQRDVLLESIAVQENIEVGAADVDAEIRRAADRAGVPPSKLRESLEKEGRLERVARDLMQGKVLAFLVERAKVAVDTKRREGRSRIILPGGGTGSSKGQGQGPSLIVPGR